jgi:hypothetical protein
VAGFSIAFNPSNEDVAHSATTIIDGENALDLLPPLQRFFKFNPL